MLTSIPKYIANAAMRRPSFLVTIRVHLLRNACARIIDSLRNGSIFQYAGETLTREPRAQIIGDHHRFATDGQSVGPACQASGVIVRGALRTCTIKIDRTAGCFCPCCSCASDRIRGSRFPDCQSPWNSALPPGAVNWRKQCVKNLVRFRDERVRGEP